MLRGFMGRMLRALAAVSSDRGYAGARLLRGPSGRVYALDVERVETLDSSGLVPLGLDVQRADDADDLRVVVHCRVLRGMCEHALLHPRRAVEAALLDRVHQLERVDVV